MKKFIVKFDKVEIHLSTFFFLFISIVTGRIQTFIFLISFAFVHEFFHYIGALCFKVRIDSISIMPFGFCLKTEPLINIEWYKELIIVILGPLSYFFSMMLINNLEFFRVISKVGAENARQANLFILCFNLLPIIPLDGAKIIKIILGFCLTERKCMKISGIISFFSLIIYILNLPVQFTIYIFLIYSQTEFWYKLKYYYAQFLVSRLKKFNHRIKIHSKNDLYRNYENILKKEEKLYCEKDFICNFDLHF